MAAETIDHHTLSNLVEAGVVQGAHVIGQAGGWAVLIKYGMLERPLAATRSKEIRKFKRMETLVAYLKQIGINRFDVDVADYSPETVSHYKRPDRSEAIKKAAEAVAHDQWFHEQVEQGLKEACDPNTQWVSQEDASARIAKKRAELLERAGICS